MSMENETNKASAKDSAQLTN